ncbi:MAG TPA: phosphate-starvation-inducible PsiE family protein [Methylophilaceae bacterium]|nr:phosphate-starvation-inducible PsiE family protein [Methylophilaceae bacterium]
MKNLEQKWQWVSNQWPRLTLYQRFENVLALSLTLIITLVILVAFYRLIIEVVGGLVFGALNPLDHTVFQAVFGEIMTLLIALEFNHTLQYVVSRQQSIIQTKTVLLIALLSLARKFVILDLKETSAEELFGLAAITLAVGITYWLMRERDDRLYGPDGPAAKAD